MRQADSALRLDALQLAWLQELGVEAALLRPYAARPSGGAKTSPRSATVPADARPDGVARSKHQALDAPAHPSSPPALQNPSKAPKGLHDNRATAARKPTAVPEAQPRAPESPHPPSRRSAALACQVYVLRADAARSGASQTPSPNWLVMREAALTASDTHTLAQGRAAQLLHAMLAAVRLQPTDAIMRLQTHPLLPHAIEGESPTLQGQIQDHINKSQPTCILALGRVAAAALLQTTQDLESLRGRVWSYANAAGDPIPVVVTYPPGWLLANPQHKANAWRDLLLARAAQSAPGSHHDT